LREYLDAIADYTEVININPAFAEAYFLRGIVKKNALGEKYSSLIDLRKAAQLFREQDNLALYKKALENIKSIENSP